MRFEVESKLEEKSEKEEKSPDPHPGGTTAHQNQTGHLYPHQAGVSGASGGHVTEMESTKRDGEEGVVIGSTRGCTVCRRNCWLIGVGQ